MVLRILPRWRGVRCLLKCVIAKVFQASRATWNPANDGLRRIHRAKVGAVHLSKSEAARLNETLEMELAAYTYLNDEPLA